MTSSHTPSTPHTPTSPTATLTTAQCAALEALLADLELHTRNSARLADDHRAAISTADAANLARCIAAQQQSAAELSALEARRAALLRSLGFRSNAGAASTVTLSQLAALAPRSRAAVLTAATARVRGLMADAAQRRESVRLASLSLMAHMQGIIRQVTANLSETKTYSPTNRLAAAGVNTAPTTVDFMT